MREDIQKNFILLSKVAKEKKYAQEYLGLLARRGDIGSIRIGKRWYTTWAWFEEFLENSQKKKNESVCEIKFSQLATVMAEEVKPIEYTETKPAFAEAMAGDVKMNAPFVFPEREKVMVVQPAVEMIHEETVAEAPARIAVAVNPWRDQIIVRKNIAIDNININLSASPIRPVKMQTEKVQIRRFASHPIRKVPIANFAPRKMVQPILQDESNLRNVSVAEKNRYAIPYQEIKFKKKAGVFSPDLSGEEKMFAPIFSRFVFATGFAMIIVLVAASGYFVWSGGLLTNGTVAGASDERNVGFSDITSGGEYVLTSAGDKMKESLSVSRVMVEAAKEKLNQDNLVN